MNQDQRDELLIGMNREIGEIKTGVDHTNKRLDRKDKWSIAVVVAAFGGLLSWFK